MLSYLLSPTDRIPQVLTRATHYDMDAVLELLECVNKAVPVVLLVDPAVPNQSLVTAVIAGAEECLHTPLPMEEVKGLWKYPFRHRCQTRRALQLQVSDSQGSCTVRHASLQEQLHYGTYMCSCPAHRIKLIYP